MTGKNINNIYHDLRLHLAGSTFANRRYWAGQIADNDIDLEALLPLLFADRKTAYRFSWLLSDIGEAAPEKLFKVLPYIFSKRHEVDVPEFEQQFVKYWRICGVPEEDKGISIDMMFRWLTDPATTVHIKTISLTMLYKLTKEYPELKNELRLCLETEAEHNSVSFKKKAKEILNKL